MYYKLVDIMCLYWYQGKYMHKGCNSCAYTCILTFECTFSYSKGIALLNAYYMCMYVFYPHPSRIIHELKGDVLVIQFS